MAKVLVIDDSATVQQFIRRTLADARHLVTVAKDGAAGMRVLARWPADLVITDIYMPDQDGLQTIRELRRAHPGVRIIAMSSHGPMGTVDVLDVARKLGADRVIRKPFTPDDLLAGLRQCLAGG